MDIVSIVVQFATTLGAIGTISLFGDKWLDNKIKPIADKIDHKDYNDSKRYLTDFLTDVEKGMKKGKKLEEIKSEIQIQMAKDTYDHYITPKKEGGLGGNSWIQDKWEALIK
jgi:hypothetical protein